MLRKERFNTELVGNILFVPTSTDIEGQIIKYKKQDTT